MTAPLTVQEWIKIGVEHGWCSPQTCSTHDGMPLSIEEDQEFAEGHDPCVPVVRLW